MMPSILDNKNTSAPSVFLPPALRREARRQKSLTTVNVAPVCILDPDGDIVRCLSWIIDQSRLGWRASGCHNRARMMSGIMQLDLFMPKPALAHKICNS